MIQQTSEQASFIKEFQSGASSISLQAVAGSGKTTTLVLAAQAFNPAPGQMLALAFNKKNAQDLERAMPGAVDCKTLNGLGHRAWGDHLRRKLLLNNDKLGEICSEVCKAHALGDYWRDLLSLCQKAKDIGLVPQAVQGCIPLVVDNIDNWRYIIALHDIANGEGLIAAARKVLTASIAKALQGEIDFADQLYMTCVFRARMPQYDIVLVDEAQDLSEIQHELISRCVKKGGRLIAVGDPKQAIYGFRGAASDSMEILQAKFSMKKMDLSYSFRCPSVVIAMAQRIVPQIKCPEGTRAGAFSDLKGEWEPESLAPGSAVLCRNVAPLIRLGFECFRAGVSAYVVGRDIGSGLLKAAKDLRGSSASELHDSVRDWQEKKRLFANGSLQLIASANDTAEALHFVIEYSKATSPGEIEEQLRKIFSKDKGSIVLSTIHKAKGLEWDSVYLLDPWRMPQKWASEAAENDPENCAWMLEQEKHLRYIAITRAKQSLCYIEYEQY